MDVPEAIVVRERFLPASERCTYIAKSATDLSWMDSVGSARNVFVTAQGLFMYFEEAEVRRVFTAIVERFPGVHIMFDTIPPWFSRQTLKGFRKTEHYVTPPMPWGVRRGRIDALVRSWSDRVEEVSTWSFGFARGGLGLLLKVFATVPGLRDVPPAITLVRTRANENDSH